MTDEEIVAELRRDSKLARIWRAINSHCAMVDLAARQQVSLSPMDRTRMEYETARAIVEILGNE